MSTAPRFFQEARASQEETAPLREAQEEPVPPQAGSALPNPRGRSEAAGARKGHQFVALNLGSTGPVESFNHSVRPAVFLQKPIAVSPKKNWVVV